MPYFPQPQSALLVGSANFVAKTGDYTASAGDFVIESPASTQTITLPLVTTGGPVAVKNLTGAHVVTIKTNEASGVDIDGIAGSTGITLGKAYDTVVLASDGANWWTVSGNLETNEAPE